MEKITVYVTATKTNIQNFEDLPEQISEKLELAGGEEENDIPDIPMKLQELLTSVSQTIATSITTESQLTIEITGSFSLKGKTGIKYVLFNAEGEAGKTQTMKLSLTTTIKPENQE